MHLASNQIAISAIGTVMNVNIHEKNNFILIIVPITKAAFSNSIKEANFFTGRPRTVKQNKIIFLHKQIYKH